MPRSFKFLVPIVCLIMVFSITASASATVDWKQCKGQTISVMAFEIAFWKGVKKFLPEFEKKTGITVEWESFNESTVIQKSQMELAARSDAYDVIYSGRETVPKWVKAGLIVPLDDFMNDPTLTESDYDLNDHLKGTVDAFQVDGKQWGFPYFGACVIYYYRTDLFKKAGLDPKNPPQTFEELLAAAKKLHSNDIAGIALRGYPGVHNTWHWSMMFYGYGGRYFKDYENGNFTPTLNTEAGVKSLEIYTELMQHYSIPNAASATFEEVVVAMQQGRTAMVLEGGPLGGRILDPDKSKIIGKVGFALVPGGPAGRFPPFTSQTYVINKASKNKNAAYLFIQWLTSRETMKKVALNSRYVTVTRSSIWTDPEFRKRYGFNYGYGDYLEAFEETLDIGPPWYRPVFPDWPEVMDRTGIALQEAVVGKKTAKEALDDANADIGAMLKKRNYKIDF